MESANHASQVVRYSKTFPWTIIASAELSQDIRIQAQILHTHYVPRESRSSRPNPPLPLPSMRVGVSRIRKKGYIPQ